MYTYNAIESDYSVRRKSSTAESIPYPYLRCVDGGNVMYGLNPSHGRSFIMGRTMSGRYIVSKGNGLSYTRYTFVHTREFGNDTWGLLLLNDALRDFDLGLEVAGLGISTNKMEYVLQLHQQIQLPNGLFVSPALLQYTVDCPYRLSDVSYNLTNIIADEIRKWESFNSWGHREKHLIAAHILISNLRTLHKHHILHNAIHPQNYTWALELLDFELACSELHPYESESDRRHFQELFTREIVQTYQIITHIATVLGEMVNFKKLDDIFNDYGFDLSHLAIY